VCEQLVGELHEGRYKSRSAGEQLGAEIVLFERSQDRAARILTDLAKLGIEQRILTTQSKINERLAGQVAAVIANTLADLGIRRDQHVNEILARHLKLMDGTTTAAAGLHQPPPPSTPPPQPAEPRKHHSDRDVTRQLIRDAFPPASAAASRLWCIPLRKRILRRAINHYVVEKGSRQWHLQVIAAARHL
jgi:hypothetical protein